MTIEDVIKICEEKVSAKLENKIKESEKRVYNAIIKKINESNLKNKNDIIKTVLEEVKKQPKPQLVEKKTNSSFADIERKNIVEFYKEEESKNPYLLNIKAEVLKQTSLSDAVRLIENYNKQKDNEFNSHQLLANRGNQMQESAVSFFGTPLSGNHDDSWLEERK